MWNPAATNSEQKALDSTHAEQIKKWEDQISNFFSETCLEFDLRAMKYLKLKRANQNTQLSELERAIEQERRKALK